MRATLHGLVALKVGHYSDEGATGDKAVVWQNGARIAYVDLYDPNDDGRAEVLRATLGQDTDPASIKLMAPTDVDVEIGKRDNGSAKYRAVGFRVAGERAALKAA